MLTKVRNGMVLRLDGIPCCLGVEEVEQYAPDISRANGWFEEFIGATLPGPGEVTVALPDDVLAKIRGLRPFGELTYRGRTVHFLSRERVVAARQYVAATNRRAADYPGNREFLENLPAEFLKASARDRVVKQLDRLLADAPS